MTKDQVLKELNSFYKIQNERLTKLLEPFLKAKSIFDYHTAYLSETYEKLKNGRYVRNYYPVSAIVVKNYGTVLLDGKSVVVQTRLSVDDLSTIDLKKFTGLEYDIYSNHERNYIYYRSTDTNINIKDKIKSIYDNDVMFEFYFDEEIEPNELYDFFKLLKKSKFKYNL